MGTKSKEQLASGTGHASLRRDADKLQLKLTQGIPTLFGRLVYVSEERDLVRIPTDILAEVHKDFFYQWLRLGLKDQKRDLLSYFGGMGDQGVLCDLRAFNMRRLIIQACEALIPQNINDSDFSMFQDRLETILDVRAQWPSPNFR